MKYLHFIGGLFFDLLLLAGGALVVYGVWLAWHPAGYIMSGLLCIVSAIIFGTRRMPRGEAR